MDLSKDLRLVLARGQIALGAIALRVGIDVGMVEGPPFTLGAGPRPEFDELLEPGRSSLIDYRLDLPKHEFLSCLVHTRRYLVHGTAAPDLPQERAIPTPH